MHGISVKIVLWAITLLCFCSPMECAFAQTYSITELGTLGGSSSVALDINEGGQIVGASSLPGDHNEHAFLFQKGKMRDLGTLGGQNSTAFAINNRGQVTGLSTYSDASFSHGFLYSHDVLRDIGASGSENCVSPAAINEFGEITGAAGCRGQMAFGYRAGQLFLLGDLGGGSSGGLSINNRGQIAGNADVIGNGFPPHAFLYTAGSLLDLGTLGGSSSVVLSNHSINRHGEVTGTSLLHGDVDSHAFIYSNGSMHDIGTLGGTFSSGQSINSDGAVVGYSTTTGDAASHAFLYRDHRIFDLNDVIDNSSPLKGVVTLFQGVAINDSGDIVAQGRNSVSGIDSAYLLQACRADHSRFDNRGREMEAGGYDGDRDDHHTSRNSCHRRGSSDARE